MPTIPELSERDMLVGRAIIFDQFGRRLLGRRAPGARNDPDKWEYFGGTYDPAQDNRALLARDTTIREFGEEYGPDLLPDPRWPEPQVLEYRPLRPYPGGEPAEGMYLSLGYHMIIGAGERHPRLPEHADEGWFFPAEIGQLLVTQATYNEVVGIDPMLGPASLLTASAR
jgi:hypothetical protein